MRDVVMIVMAGLSVIALPIVTYLLGAEHGFDTGESATLWAIKRAREGGNWDEDESTTEVD